MNLPDVQNQEGNYTFPVKAGVSNIKMPIRVRSKKEFLSNPFASDKDLMTTVASVDMSVRLSSQLKGINMSRLPIILNEMRTSGWVLDNLQTTLSVMMDRMESDAAYVRMHFPYFFEKLSPVTYLSGLAHCDCSFTAMKTAEPGSYKLVLGVDVPVMTLCPCSKEISKYSAHNQRALVSVQLCYGDSFVWIEDVVKMAEESSSTGLYPILKRVDEKYVTEKSYENPRFVEDLARIMADKLTADERVQQFHVSVRSEESIHQHDAIAEVEGGLTDIWCL